MSIANAVRFASSVVILGAVGYGAYRSIKAYQDEKKVTERIRKDADEQVKQAVERTAEVRKTVEERMQQIDEESILRSKAHDAVMAEFAKERLAQQDEHERTMAELEDLLDNPGKVVNIVKGQRGKGRDRKRESLRAADNSGY